MAHDLHNNGENVMHGLAGNIFYMQSNPVVKFLLGTLLRAIGMGRTAQALKNAKERTHVELEADLKEWKQFCYDFSLKW